MSVTASLTELTTAEIDACHADPAVLTAILTDRTRVSCGLDKAWAGLWFLFAAGDYPFEAAMLDVQRTVQIGPYRVNFVHPGALDRIADNLDSDVRAAHLGQFYDPTAMQGVYPDIWVRDGEAARDYLLSFIPALRTFAFAATDRKAGAVVVIG